MFDGWAGAGVDGGGYWNDYDIEKMSLSYEEYGDVLTSVFPYVRGLVGHGFRGGSGFQRISACAIRRPMGEGNCNRAKMGRVALVFPLIPSDLGVRLTWEFDGAI